MRKYNKFGAAYRNIKQFDVERVDNVDKNAAVFRIYSGKDDFYLFFLPNSIVTGKQIGRAHV